MAMKCFQGCHVVGNSAVPESHQVEVLNVLGATIWIKIFQVTEMK